jgi:nucleoside-diphosphate-sugar epimerase
MRLKSILVTGSIADPAVTDRALDGMDAVCHLASSKEDAKFLDVSTRGTFNLLEAARKPGGLKQFILAGGDCSLGIFYYPNPKPLDEKAPLRAYPGSYALSKVLEETLCGQYAIQYRLPVTILRCSWIWESGDAWRHLFLQKPDFGIDWEKLSRNKKQKELFFSRRAGVGCLCHPGGRPYFRHVVAVEDVVQSFLLALGNPAAVGETFNIAATSPFNYQELARHAGRRLGLPVVKFIQPGFHDFTISINKARKILGYNPQYDAFRLVDEAAEILAHCAICGKNQPSNLPTF